MNDYSEVSKKPESVNKDIHLSSASSIEVESSLSNEIVSLSFDSKSSENIEKETNETKSSTPLNRFGVSFPLYEGKEKIYVGLASRTIKGKKW